MEFLLPHTPLAVAIILLFALVVCVRFIIDMKEVVAARRLRGQVARYVREQNIPTVSVIIELDRRAETIMPLIDHLYEHNYPGLEVVIIVKHTAGKNAQPKLACYRRKEQCKNLKIIKHTKGLTQATIVRRYTTGSLIMRLAPEDRLLKGFFADVALEFLDENITVVQPRRHSAINSTLLSAMHATLAIWHHMGATLRKRVPVKSSLESGLVYRRQALIEATELRSVYSLWAAIQVKPQPSWAMLGRRVQCTVINSTNMYTRWAMVAGLVAVIGLAILFWNQDLLLLGYIILLSFCIVYVLSMISVKGYSLPQKLSLLLFVPFSFIFTALLLLYSLSISLLKRDRNLR